MKYRRYIIFIIVLTILVSLWFIPKSGPEKIGLDSSRPVKVTFAHSLIDEQNVILNELVDEFNKTEGKRVGIIVEPIYYGPIEYISEIVSEAVSLGLPSKKICDMNTVTYETAYLTKILDKTANLDDNLEKSKLKQYVSGYLEPGRFTTDSKRSVFPLPKDTQVIYANKVIWDKFKEQYPAYTDSVFETWEGIIEASIDYYNWTDSITPDIQNDGKAFIAFDTLEHYLFTGSNQMMSSLIQQGHKEVNINLDIDSMYKLWNTIYKATIMGAISVNNDEFVYDQLSSGNVVCYTSPSSEVAMFPYAYTSILTGVGETKLQAFEYPVFNNQRKVSPVNGAGVIVMKSDKKKEYACFYFLDWMTSQNKYIDLCVSSLTLPVKKDSLKSEYLSNAISQYEKSKERRKQYIGIVLRKASMQVSGKDTYSPVSFPKSTEFKTETVNSFYYNIYVGLGIVDALMSEGYSREQAILSVCSYESFELWYKNVTDIAEKY